MTASRNIVAAQLVVFVNGRMFGEVTAFNFSSATPREEIMAIDSMHAQELAPTTMKLSGAISFLRRHSTGGLEGRGIIAPPEKIPEERYFSLLMLNRRDKTIFFRADECAVMQQSFVAEARGLVTGSFTFMALHWSNELDLQFRSAQETLAQSRGF
jgi:hypothetical protein